MTTRETGRPRTAKTLIAVRLAATPLALVDAWIADQGEPRLSRPEALRRLVELAITLAKPKRAKRSVTSSKSTQLAADQLDRMSDDSASAEIRETRKRRLLKGPSEFRDVRKDRKKR